MLPYDSASVDAFALWNGDAAFAAEDFFAFADFFALEDFAAFAFGGAAACFFPSAGWGLLADTSFGAGAGVSFEEAAHEPEDAASFEVAFGAEFLADSGEESFVTVAGADDVAAPAFGGAAAAAVMLFAQSVDPVDGGEVWIFVPWTTVVAVGELFCLGRGGEEEEAECEDNGHERGFVRGHDLSLWLWWLCLVWTEDGWVLFKCWWGRGVVGCGWFTAHVWVAGGYRNCVGLVGTKGGCVVALVAIF